MQLASVFYQVLFLFSILLTMLYIITWHRHFDVHITLTFTLVPISIMGNLMTARASNLEEAILANKLTYFGGTFLVLMITLTILHLCDIHVNRWIKVLMYALSFIIHLSALTIGWRDWFYKSCDFTIEDGTGFIINKEYGFMHTVFLIVIIAYFTVSFCAMIYSFFRKKNVSRKIIFLIFVPELFCGFAFFGGRQFFDRIELLPAAYIAAQIVYLIIIHQACLYDITESGVDSIVQTGNTGFLSFDFRRHYLGSNETARMIFPGLNDVRIDTVIPPESPVAADISQWLDAFAADEQNNHFYYHHGDNIYLVTVSYLYDGKRRRGYQLFITDDTKSQQYIELLNNFNEKLKDQVAEKTQHIEEMHDKLILGMATMVESRDNSTGGHIRRTSEVVRMLTDEIRSDNVLQLSDDYIRNLIKAAPMHDLGKIAVDDEILRKPGRFTPEEFEKMKSHAREGARIVHDILEGTDDVQFHIIAENMAQYHHERWDGSGYPDGLREQSIPLEARIMAVADVYDALVSKRVYKDRMSFEKADSIIMESMGKHFDPSLERYYTAARPKLEAYYSSLEE